jgi:hypothetical protein
VTQENFDRAIALTRLNCKVFPWRTVVRNGKESKVPLTERGHLDATLDPEQIATWYLSEFTGPEIGIGVHVGASGLVVADLDRKHGKDGFESTEGWLDFPATFSQDTPSGGKHYVYEAPEGVRLAPGADVQGFVGLDVRSGSSWCAWYGAVPEDRSAFAPAPAWLCEPAEDRVGAAFEGGLDDWLDSLPEASGEPDGRVLDAILRIPDEDFGHVEMVERVWEMVRLGAEGYAGVRHALELLREAWLRDPWDNNDNRYSFDRAVDGAIKKAGALEERVAAFPKLIDLLANASNDVVSAITGDGKGKAHWFRTAKTLLRREYSEDDALAILWQAASTKAISREWGVEFCAERLAELRTEVDAEQREAKRVETHAAGATAQEDVLAKPVSRVHLLKDSEREYLAKRPNFVHRYVRYAEARFTRINPNYHRSAAFTILSMAFARNGFIAAAGKPISCNLYQNTLGKSGTGKTEAQRIRREVTQLLFENDQLYLVGSESSPEMLHEDLLARGGAPTLFHDDEAAQFFGKLNQRNGWGAGLETKLTDWYEGWVNPVRKRAAKTDGKGSPCYLVAEFYSTPERLFKELTTDQFLSGFLARFQWSVGQDADDTENRFQFRQATHKDAEHTIDPGVLDIVTELKGLRDVVGSRRPLLATDEGLARLEEMSMAIEAILKKSGRWDITEAAYRRLRDAIWKASGLLAMARGQSRIEMVDILGAIEQAEVWVEGLLYASAQISSSQIERDSREIAVFVKQKGDPWVSERVVYRAFSRYTPKEFQERIEHALRTGLITSDHTKTGVRYGWDGRSEE